MRHLLLALLTFGICLILAFSSYFWIKLDSDVWYKWICFIPACLTNYIVARKILEWVDAVMNSDKKVQECDASKV